MSNLARGQVLWSRILNEKSAMPALADVARGLSERYGGSNTNYIPSYELAMIFDKVGANKQAFWKPVVDFLCYRSRIFILHFRLIDDDDSFEVSLELMQTILAGDDIRFGSRTYKAEVAAQLTVPYFVPTSRFFLLNEYLKHEPGQ